VTAAVTCDGCGAGLVALVAKPGPGQRRRAVTGQAWPASPGGGGLPGGRFDWCGPCALIAFTALASWAAARDPGRRTS
jgi:hypothetical protein